MTDLVTRFSTESLLPPDRGARVRRPRLHTVDAHWHDYHELCLVVPGEAEPRRPGSPAAGDLGAVTM
ncbi:hypothetical protein E1295_02095 [Nonomuraea mesophila]|uniref:Uncharacterized protein n=1 Tax=Nonomuraea mesophila TaxID=2530382 RepID=A0A4R5FWZ6_9ACTN|nr:hypothetical protein [Nonomuraea mesophila]TDE59703.1 hypothetical protein E1295_02095 [Nonomuraea mesophila]